MENQVIAPALTDEERRFLFDQRNSEHYRVFAKAITSAYSTEAAKLVSLDASDLSRAQGVLQGLLLARGIVMTLAESPVYDGPSPQRPRILKSK